MKITALTTIISLLLFGFAYAGEMTTAQRVARTRAAVEQYVKAAGAPLKVTCSYMEYDRAVGCNLTLAQAQANPRMMHWAQQFAWYVANDLAIKDPHNFSIFAMAEDIPLARFIYNEQFDELIPLYMWR